MADLVAKGKILHAGHFIRPGEDFTVAEEAAERLIAEGSAVLKSEVAKVDAVHAKRRKPAEGTDA